MVDLVLGKSCYYTKENDFPRLVGYSKYFTDGDRKIEENSKTRKWPM